MQIDVKTLVMYGWSFAVGVLLTLSIRWQDNPKTEVVCIPLPALAGHVLPANLAADATVVDAATADVPAPATASVTK